MNATRQLQQLGQSIWLDNITRSLLDSGTLARYIREYAVTGLTSNPTIFEHAIGKSDSYDAAIRRKSGEGKAGEDLFFELALDDLTRAADLFRPVFDATDGVDGWASLEVSPLLAYDAIDTMPDKTLLAFAERGTVKGVLPDDGGESAAVIAACRQAGIDDAALARRLQREGAEAFSKSWRALMQQIASKTKELSQAGAS